MAAILSSRPRRATVLRMVDLSPDLFRSVGRAVKMPSAAVVRQIEEADLALLQEEKGSKPSALKRLSERHHSLARHLANGMAPSDAALICGYSISRVSILQDDPAFRELLEFYRAEAARPFRDMAVRLSHLSLSAVDELTERLEEEPEKLSIGQLLEISKMGADRTGFGPQSSNTNVNVNIDLAARLEAARKRVADRRGEE